MIEFLSPETDVLSVRSEFQVFTHEDFQVPEARSTDLWLSVFRCAEKSPCGCSQSINASEPPCSHRVVWDVALPRSLTGVETALRMHRDVATDGRRDTNSESRSQFLRLVVPCPLPPRLDVLRSRHHSDSDNKSLHENSDVAPTGSAFPEFAPLFVTFSFQLWTVLVSVLLNVQYNVLLKQIVVWQ